MNIACIIPARFNSSRFPGKLLATAQGKSVLQRTFENAARCPELDSLFVATDDERIAGHVRGFGGEVLWTSERPLDGTQRIIEALQTYPELSAAEIVLNLQGDHPCTPPKTMSAVISALKADPEASMSTAVAPMKSETDFLSPHVVKCVFTKQMTALYFSRSPIPYNKPMQSFAHVGIYCYRKKFLTLLAGLPTTPLQKAEDLEQLNILELGYKIKVAIVEEKEPSVDTPLDLVKLEEYLCR